MTMTKHDGISCDSCLRNNFPGPRYKCLICYDFDLCASCYHAKNANSRHSLDHPVQCIMTRSDIELFYGGEVFSTADLCQSFTCPYCSKMGFTPATLQEHQVSEHSDVSFPIICPVCIVSPGADPNLVTDDFAGHLVLEHRTGGRMSVNALEDGSNSSRLQVRRIPYMGHIVTSATRGSNGMRPRRSNINFSVFSSSGVPAVRTGTRESDPLADFLSQITRRVPNSNSLTHPLQVQLQLDAQHIVGSRSNSDDLARRQTQSQTAISNAASVTAFSNNSNNNNNSTSNNNNPTTTTVSKPKAQKPPVPSKLVLKGSFEDDFLPNWSEEDKAEHIQFVNDMMASLVLPSLATIEELTVDLKKRGDRNDE